ncbi:F0F1 ATP synthase subunit gamma, partial [Candidatus Uhrbacteria bacterium]|nr:F0F1 ATP synthase subunit gamma [Candidatus Uhrbacteria bacterium]
MAGSKEIKRRLKSVNNTKKITKAMELVSAAKMRRAINRVVSSRHYAGTSWDVLNNVSAKVKKVHSLALKQAGVAPQVEFISLGKKVRDGLHKSKVKIAADFPKDDITLNVLKILPLIRLVTEDYIAGKYDQVVLVYTDFISSLNQKPRVKTLLPFNPRAEGEVAPETLATEEAEVNGSGGSSEEDLQEYLFEPSMNEILDVLLPRILEVQVYQSVLESEASEHSARMMTMRNASDAAGDIIDDLTLTYNQARQSGITRE